MTKMSNSAKWAETLPQPHSRPVGTKSGTILSINLIYGAEMGVKSGSNIIKQCEKLTKMSSSAKWAETLP